MREPLRVLIVEDSEADAELLLVHLRQAGFDVSHERVESGPEMQRALDSAAWDVVISDFQLPVFSAPSALEVLRRSGCDVPFLAVSGTIEEESAVAALRAGAHDFISKDRLARLAPAIRRELADAAERRARRQAEVALRESEDLFRQMADSIDEVFWLLDPESGAILYVSRAWESVWGRSCAELRANPGVWLETIDPADRLRVRDAAVAAVRSAGSWEDVYAIVRPDGTKRTIRDRAFPVRDAGGRLFRVAGIAEDITALRAAETALRSRDEELRQAQKMEAIGRLAAGVAHDFNNLLTVIQGYTEMALSVPATPDLVRRHLGEVRRAGERAAELTQQLLAFGRRQMLDLRVLDLNHEVRGLEELLRRLVGEDVEFVFVLGTGVPPVLADSGQIGQVVMNLVVNARDAMPRGGRITIETARAEFDPGYAASHPDVVAGLHATLAISDTGVGMDAETAARVFEPFFTTKEQGKGTGLGLSTVHGIVRQCGGHVHVTSAPGRGATFRIHLPAATGSSDPRIPNHGDAAGAPRGKEFVLVVEDDASVRRYTHSVLRDAGYEVADAPDPKNALARVQNLPRAADLIVTDVVMPQMSGPDLAAELSRMWPAVRVLYVSGYTEAAVLERGIPDRRAFLQKPFTRDALLRRVREILDRPVPGAVANGLTRF